MFKNGFDICCGDYCLGQGNQPYHCFCMTVEHLACIFALEMVTFHASHNTITSVFVYFAELVNCHTLADLMSFFFLADNNLVLAL